MNGCWMTNREPVCNITLGKLGDAMILLPGMKAIYDATGIPPVFMISDEFASVLDGVSYVEPWVVHLNWFKEVGKALDMALSKFRTVLVGKWWDIPGAKPPLILDDSPKTTLMQHGRTFQVSTKEWDSYQSSQWRYSGFSLSQMMTLPLVFDRRDAKRESDLRRRVFKTDRPKVLVNLFPGGTSPWPYGNTFNPTFTANGFEVVNLSMIQAERIYDLLGLYDHAAGLVTSDTATLHLAGASHVPYIAFVNNGGLGSIPRGNCVLKVRYKDALESKPQIERALLKFHEAA